MAERQYLGQGTNTGAEKFWYVLGCIYFGAAYLQKVPVKKALNEYGLVEMTGAESFWYVVLCICFGAGYFAKVPVKRALAEVRDPNGAFAAQMGQLPPGGYQAGYPAQGYPAQGYPAQGYEAPGGYPNA